MACCLSLTMSARVAYLLPNGCAYNSASGELTGFPNEPRWYSIENRDIDQAPERAAAYWFKDNYVLADNGVFVTPAQFIANNADIQVLWMYLDRDISRDDVYTIFGGNDFKDALTAFVKRGGNVFMCKQANRFLQDIGRTSMGIDHGNTGYTNGHGDTWYAAVDFDNRQHRGQDHPIFKDMGKWEHEDKTDIEFQKTKAGYDNCTDNNCGINRDHMGIEGHQCDKNYINTFDSNNAARVLGGWGGTGCCDYGGIIEFYPQGDFKGTVLMMGLAAYQWAELNEKIGNVRLFTSNVLTYLNGPSRADVHIDEDFRADGREGADGDAHNRFMILHPNVRGLNAVAYDVIENAGITEKINDGANRLAFTSAGHVKLQIKLNETRSEQQNWARGIYTFTRDIDFAFNTTAQAIADADLSSNGLDGETGKFMVLHRNMRGLAAPIENYEISYDGIEETNRAVVEKFWDGEFDRLKFTKAGTVKLNITMNSDVHNTEYGKGEHHAVKTVTFDQPAFSWSHTPDVASIGEDKDPVVATCTNVPGVTTVKFESDNTEIATIDENTGKIAYIKQGSCNVYAYVEISSVKFRSEAQAVTVNGLNILWDNEPKASVFISDQPAVAAHIEYGAGTIQYECTNCSYSEGHLTFTAAGTATIRPYVATGGETYYGEQKTITVVDPATTNPSAATAFLLLGDANALPESERNCAEWFLNGDVKSGAGRYLAVTDLSSIPATVKTIIIHADREAPVFDFSDYASNLAAWVKAGGNLVLMRQATMLAYQMNRIDYAPHNDALVMEDNPKKTGHEDRVQTDFTAINACLGTRDGLATNSKGETSIDRSGDDFFNGMTITPGANGQKLITLNTANRRASNCCFWQEMYFQNPGSENTEDFATESRAKFDQFESKYNCQVLAVEAGILDFCLPAIIRFKSGTYNAETWKGSIMAIGAGGFQFNNENQANFEVLGHVAENAKEYVAGGSACNNCFTITIR